MLAFLTLVRDPEHAPNPALRLWRTLRGLPARFSHYLGAVGALADRIGPRPVLMAGYALGAGAGLLIALAFWLRIDTVGPLAAVFVAARLYVAVQDTLEPTVTAALVEQAMLATSHGALGPVKGVTKLVASALVGIVWTALSPVWAFGLAATLMAAGALALGRVGPG